MKIKALEDFETRSPRRAFARGREYDVNTRDGQGFVSKGLAVEIRSPEPPTSYSPFGLRYGRTDQE